MSRGQTCPDGHRPKGVSLATRVVTAQQALGIIAAENAFAKNIATLNPHVEAPLDNPNNGWGFLTLQLQDPEYYRPARTVPEGANRKNCYDPSDGEWHEREVITVKGESKPGATFTKKTAVSLLPADGQMQFYPQKHGIVMVFDVEKCKVKQYIFDHNVCSDERWWLEKPAGQRKHSLERSTTLEAIRQQHRKAKAQGIILNWNEVLPDLCADAVIAVAVPQFDLVRCLNAQYRRLILRRELNIDVPLLIMTKDKPVFEYTKAMQLQHLANARTSPSNSIYRDFYNAITVIEPVSLQSLTPNVSIDIFQAVRERDLFLIELVLKQNPDYLKKVKENRTPIRLAANLKYWDCVLLIANQATADAKDIAEYGGALCDAAAANESVVALALVNAGAAVDWRTLSGAAYKGYYAIHYAIHHNDYALLEAILAKHPVEVVNLKHDEYITYVDSEGYSGQRRHVFAGITPLQLALDSNDAESMRLLIKYGANRIDNQIASMVNANSQKWDCALAYCNAIFSNGGDASAVLGQLSSIACMQKKAGVMRKIMEMMAKLTCQIEREDIKKAESLARKRNIVDEELVALRSIHTFILEERSRLFSEISIRDYKQFGDAELKVMSETYAPLFEIFCVEKCEKEEKEKNETINSILELQQALSNQINVLEIEIQTKAVASRAPVFFGKMIDSLNANESEKKSAKKKVLSDASLLLEKQLSLGGAVLPEDFRIFEKALLDTAHWNDGRNNRTVVLIDRARVLMQKSCAKSVLKEEVASASAILRQ